jgi:gamma-glutamylcyclotransferase
MMSVFQYFAYGSNMLTRRLTARCKSAVPKGKAFCSGFELNFSKLSKDGSGKATLVRSSNSATRVWGVVYDVAFADRAVLDRYEGVGAGYERVTNFLVQTPQKTYATETYLATSPGSRLMPYDWYLALVLVGALEHGIDMTYISKLRRGGSVADSNINRKERADALKLLEEPLLKLLRQPST